MDSVSAAEDRHGDGRRGTDTWVFDCEPYLCSRLRHRAVAERRPFPVEMFGPRCALVDHAQSVAVFVTPGAGRPHGHAASRARRQDWTFTSADTNKAGSTSTSRPAATARATASSSDLDPASVAAIGGRRLRRHAIGGIESRSAGSGEVSYRTQFISQYPAKPKPYVRTPIASPAMLHTKYYSVYGYLKPRHTAGTFPSHIQVEERSSGSWKSYGYVKAKASNYYTYTKYSKKLRLAYKGKWRLRAYAPA